MNHESKQTPIEILLATYNGAGFLEAQLDSILTQTHTNWTLLVRDDGSRDATREVIQRYVTLHPDRIRLIEDAETNLGPAQNFLRLLEHSSADYIAFCDQDDVWLPEKLEWTLATMLQTERDAAVNTPVLVHTDLRPVNAQLQPLAASFWAYQHLEPKRAGSLKLSLLQNVVTGCTVMVNRALVRLVPSMPQNAIMHDWWLTLVAAAFGRVVHLDRPTVAYRQHAQNQVGAQRWDVRFILKKIGNPSLGHSIERKLLQAQAFLERYDLLLSEAQRAEVSAFARLRQQNAFTRRFVIVRHGFWFHGLPRNIGWWWNA
jgi:hypothetical protein